MFNYTLSAITLALLFSGLCAGAASAKTPYFGINQDFVWTDDKEIPGLIQAVKESHAQAVRMGVRWSVVEPERGKWDFSRVDRMVKAVRGANVEILAVLGSVPPWASEVNPAEAKRFSDSYPPKCMADWEEYVRRCAGRYKGDIRYWEIWNEENGETWYNPRPNAPEYAGLLKSAYITIKKADPKATVVLGGLQMNGIIANPWSNLKVENFLQDVYDAGGRKYFDVVNIHPYVLATKDMGPAYCAKLTRDAVELMKKNGDGRKPLWITETGLAVNATVTEQMQADHLRGIYEELGRIPQVKAIYWFLLRDGPTLLNDGSDSMGLISSDGHRRLSFEAYKALAAGAKR